MSRGPAEDHRGPPSLGGGRALFVYGVVTAPDDGSRTASALDGLTGLDGGQVELVQDGALAAVVSLIDVERPPGRRADLLAYQAVLTALAEAGAVAPVRFGSVLPDVDSVVHDVLRPRGPEFADLLDRLRDRSQFTLRAALVEEAVLTDLVTTDPRVRALRDLTRGLPEEASVRERMQLGKLVTRGLEERSAREADSLLRAVLPMTAAHLVRSPPSVGQVIDVALLLDRDRTDELLATLEELAEAGRDSIRLRLVGPLPAYDFVGEASWA